MFVCVHCFHITHTHTYTLKCMHKCVCALFSYTHTHTHTHTHSNTPTHTSWPPQYHPWTGSSHLPPSSVRETQGRTPAECSAPPFPPPRTCAHLSVCVCVRARACICTCMDNVCMYAHMYVCMYVCVYIWKDSGVMHTKASSKM